MFERVEKLSSRENSRYRGLEATKKETPALGWVHQTKKNLPSLGEAPRALQCRRRILPEAGGLET